MGVVILNSPTAGNHAATKDYVDGQVTIHDGMITAVDHGALAWTSDPQTTGTFALTLGSVYAVLFRAAATGTCNNIKLQVTTGQTVTTVLVSITDLSGNQLGISGNVASSFSSTGAKTLALGSGVALVAGQLYVATILAIGGTGPTIMSSVGGNAPALGMTAGASAPLRQQKTSSTARTGMNNPETWASGYAVVGNAPLMLMTV